MKSLQDKELEKWRFCSEAIFEGVSFRPEEPDQVILLLHGYSEKGRRIYRRLAPYLPKSALILSPNAPYPVVITRASEPDLAYSWYFFYEGQYLVNQDLARSWLKDLLHLSNPKKLPLTIIGFSQGGYLAPLIAQDNPECKLVVGIGCEFRNQLVAEKIHYALEAVHGEQDMIVKPNGAQEEVEALRSRGIKCGWHPVEGARHEINQSVGLKIQSLLESHGKRSL